MTPSPMEGLRVLIVEDQFLIAEEMSRAVRSLGGGVIGPCSGVGSADALIRSEAVDLALLDVNLRGENVFALAEELDRRGVPFAFATGCEEWVLPEQFRSRPRLQKPVTTRLLRELTSKMHFPPRP